MWCDPEAEPYLVTQLEQALGCPVVLANQTAPAPPYPYVSYTITTPVHHVGGTYGTACTCSRCCKRGASRRTTGTAGNVSSWA